jgi:hypothetical protein
MIALTLGSFGALSFGCSGSSEEYTSRTGEEKESLSIKDHLCCVDMLPLWTEEGDQLME